MITKISIIGPASYNQTATVEPTKINYVYGANGSGKTTISRVIASPEAFSGCELEWQSGNKLPAYVYNRDFVNSNFRQDTKLKGIFTLGNTTPEIESEIEEKIGQIQNVETVITGLRTSLAAKIDEQKNDLATVIDAVYEIKKDNEEYFKESMAGFLRPKESFFNKCREEQTNSEELLSLDNLIERHNAVYKSELTPIAPLEKLSLDELIELETKDIFSQSIVGKTESQIAVLIDRLQNGDWIHNGLEYLRKSENVCPFCQQNVSQEFRTEIENIFDLTYRDKLAELETAVSSYSSFVSGFLTKLEAILSRNISVYTFSELPRLIPLVKEIFSGNILLLTEKTKSPSIKISLKSISDLCASAVIEVDLAIDKIENHNRIVAEIGAEKALLKKLVWKYIATEATETLSAYNRKDSGNGRAIQSLNSRITSEEITLESYKRRLRELEGQITSVPSG